MQRSAAGGKNVEHFFEMPDFEQRFLISPKDLGAQKRQKSHLCENVLGFFFCPGSRDKKQNSDELEKLF